MKTAVRALALGIFAAGASAAVLSSPSHSGKATMVVSHQAVVSAYPVPACGPDHCPPTSSN